MDSTEGREKGRPAREIEPPITANPRPGTRTIVAVCGQHARWRLSRVGLTTDDAIEEEVSDYLHGLMPAGLEVAADTPEAIAYAEGQPDVAIWEGERCLAVIRPRPGGDPEVTRFDGRDDGWPLPLPSTDAERRVWDLVKEHGAAVCHSAIVEKVYPNLGPRLSAPVILTTAESMVLRLVRNLGEREAIDRIHFAGPYGAIAGAIDRLGRDAVDDLRRIIAAGPVPLVEPPVTRPSEVDHHDGT